MISTTTHYYSCDGGKNPAHHQARNCEIIKTDGEEFSIWEGTHSGYAKTFDEAQSYLTVIYDRVILKSIVISYTHEINKVIK